MAKRLGQEWRWEQGRGERVEIAVLETQGGRDCLPINNEMHFSSEDAAGPRLGTGGPFRLAGWPWCSSGLPLHSLHRACLSHAGDW